jgi:ubiquinone/menaquinone biosynthesis C-methylase UbiE
MITHDENSIRSWFDQLYAARQSRSMRPSTAYLAFLDYLPLQKGMKLLDIGCGTGWLLKAASERGLYTSGIDLSSAAVELSRKNSPASIVELARVTKIPFPDNTFDFVTCIGVLEHFTELEQSIAEMKRVTKNEALFCIMVPNSRTLYWKVWQRFSKEHRESNENALSLKEWQELFQRYGFRIQELSRDEWRLQKMVSLIGINSDSQLYQMIKKFIWKVIPLSRAQQFIFILKTESR